MGGFAKVLVGCLVATGLCAEEKKGEGPIQDNSFLVEEAYNQEPGIIQHIQTSQWFRQSKDWVYTFTQEWPVPDETHQLSFTLPFLRMEASLDGRRAAGDLALNYRYQLLGNGEAALAIAPRFTVLLPTGDPKQLRGAGAAGYQINIPVSVVLGREVVTHFNLGGTLTPRAQNAAGDRADTRAWNLGQSLIWLAHPNVNAMLEYAYCRGEVVAGARLTERASTAFLNPGVRFALNFKNGLQVVPGISMPIGVGPSRGEKAVFLYLSFEHPAWRAK